MAATPARPQWDSPLKSFCKGKHLKFYRLKKASKGGEGKGDGNIYPEGLLFQFGSIGEHYRQ